MLHAGEPVVEIHPTDAARYDLRANQLARIESRWGTASARVRIASGQRPGEVFAPMHWNNQFARDARVNAAVNPTVDPVSGQPELKHTPVRVVPAGATWYAFALSRERVAPGDGCVWSAAPGVGHWRYELAGISAVVPDQLIERFRPAAATAERLDISDAAVGTYRTAWLVDGRIAACIFIGASPELPARDWLAGLFAADALTATERTALLAGRAPSAAPAAGPIVCVCFGVPRGAIVAAVRAGAGTCEKVGATLKAGTNCGSCLPEIRALLPV
jgi:assimilatory nitrate reductase catalytic subunit